MNPIKLQTVKNQNRLYANITGITKGTITCYFDFAGNLLTTTIEKNSPKEKELTKKLLDMIETRGVVLPN